MATLAESCVALSRLLKQQNLVMATAESCTGGGVAEALTDISGASVWFDRAYVTYSNRAKEEILHVQSQTLLEFGAVSRECVLEMVTGLLKISNVDVGVSISGIAGPDGGTADKPVGLVWFAFAANNRPASACKQIFTGDRAAIRQQACQFAVEELLAYLS